MHGHLGAKAIERILKSHRGWMLKSTGEMVLDGDHWTKQSQLSVQWTMKLELPAARMPLIW
jgi:hypothetical protein